MKAITVSTLLLALTIPLSAQHTALPVQWDKDFVISIAHTGSMSGGSSRVTFTYDSCTYVSNSRHKASEKKKFALTAAHRDKILKKMHALKIDKIKSEMSRYPQHDGWSDTLCFGGNCIEGGSHAEMTEEDRNTFLTASRFLEEFALKGR